MAYSARADVERAAGGEKALAQLTDLNGARTGEVDEDVLNAAIAEADATINSYIGRNVAVPLAEPIPTVIRRISADETVYLLRARTNSANEYAQNRHDDNLKWLESAARGFLTLGVEPQRDKSSLVSPAVVEVAEDDREITAESLEGIW